MSSQTPTTDAWPMNASVPDQLGCSDNGPALLNSELAFYERYAWCLNAFPTIGEMIGHLRNEVSWLSLDREGWCRAEAMVNAFLLMCAISDSVDDHLVGSRYDFSQAAAVFGPSRLIIRPVARLLGLAARIRDSRLRELRRWRDDWEAAVGRFMRTFAVGAEPVDGGTSSESVALLSLLRRPLPAAVLATRFRIPAAFRSQDLTHWDVLKLGRKLVEEFPDRNRSILVVGLRTAGSYFAPLLRGYLESEGFTEVASVTLRPKRGVGLRERGVLARAAKPGALGALIDEPVGSASTMAKGVECLRKAGFTAADIVALFPVHPKGRNWQAGAGALALSMVRVLTLEPEEWHKQVLLEPEMARRRLRDYLEGDGHVSVDVRPSAAADQLTAALADRSESGFHWRLKRIYEVELQDREGSASKRLILAKSVGWGWLGYHAFLAGRRLAPLVPRILGLRDGLLYMEWRVPETRGFCEAATREHLLDSAALYLASRVHKLALAEDPTRDLIQAGRHRGTDELAGVLSGAYGSKIAAALNRPRIQEQLSNLPCAVPTLIDGKMRLIEWVDGAGRFLKTDFEHHGMGKHELNVTDPAYDLAEVILHWSLSEDEERRLIRRYAHWSGDAGVTSRLFLNKLLSGTWAMARAADNLKDIALLDHRDQFNQEYLKAWDFLTIHTTRFCAGLCRRPHELRWSGPLVVLDVDGVLDLQIFGFPSTTAAGIQAVSLLASHGMAVALNTARSVPELKEYCRAYGFVGGVAEYGAFAWDAASGREQVLVSSESLAQMDQLKNRLRTIPGVFLNDAYQFSIRAYAYQRGRTVPLPEMLVRGLIASLNLDRLKLHQTHTDSTVTAAEADKGSGLQALLSLAGHTGLETVAVGDTEPDLPMFRVASRCFAPAQISCPQPARLLGCRIAKRRHQLGLLEIVRSLAHPDGGRCGKCLPPDLAVDGPDGVFLHLLHVADRNQAGLLVWSLFDPKAIRAFSQ